jgi:hypothetical protein
MRKCSRCGIIGHNKRTCDLNSSTIQSHQSIGDESSTNNERTGEEGENQLELRHHLEWVAKKITTKEKMLKIYDYISNKQNELKVTQKTAIYDKKLKYFGDNEMNSDEFSKIPDMPLWFNNQEYTKCDIHEYLINNPKTNHISICAQMGSGKSALMNCLSFMLCALFDYTGKEEQYRQIDDVFVMTGYSSKDYEEEMNMNFDFIRKENIFHLNNIFTKFKSCILKHPEKLMNAIIFIDEARLVVRENQTFHKLFESLGLNNDIIARYNILIFYIDATPDSVTLSLNHSYNEETVSPMFIMDPGDGYKGIQYFKQNPQFKINDIVLGQKWDISIESHMRELSQKIKDSGKTGVLRIVKEDDRGRFIMIAKSMGIDVYTYSSTSPWPPSNSNISANFNHAIGSHYENPTIFILIKKYTCSKRLVLTKNIGTIYEQPTSNTSDPTTVQGLLSRFFGYYDMAGCNVDIYVFMTHFERYLEFIETSKLSADYQSTMVRRKQLMKKTYQESLIHYNPSRSEKNAQFLYDDENMICSGNDMINYLKLHDSTKHIEEKFCPDRNNSEITENGEIYEDFNHLLKRMRFIKDDADYYYPCTTTNIYPESYINGIGKASPFSNHTCSLDEFKQGNDLALCRVNKFSKGEQPEKHYYHLRWIRKIDML